VKFCCVIKEIHSHTKIKRRYGGVNLDVSKYIGINYGFNGRSRESTDCVGLMSIVFDEEHWMPRWDDGKSIEEQWYIKEPYRMLRFLCKNFIPIRNIEDLEAEDVLYFNIGHEGHLGLFLRYGKVLTTFVPGCKQWDGSELPSKSMIIHRSQWSQGFIAGFRRHS